MDDDNNNDDVVVTEANGMNGHGKDENDVSMEPNSNEDNENKKKKMEDDTMNNNNNNNNKDNENDNNNGNKEDMNDIRNNEKEEKTVLVDDPNVEVATIVLDIPRIQWFIIKNDQRKQLACDNVQIVTHPEKKDILIFTFPNNRNISYVLCKEYPCIKTHTNTYIFGSNHEFYGLYIDTSNPDSLITEFELTIQRYSHLKISTRLREIHELEYNDDLRMGPPDKIAMIGVKTAEYIRKGTVVVTRGIRRGTVHAVTGLHKGKDALKTKIVPLETPASVGDGTHSKLFKAKMATEAICKVSGAILTGTMAAANVLSNEISDAVSSTELGQKIVNESGPKTKAAKELIKSGITGAVTLYDEVVNAGLHLVRETGHATTDIVGHKYGDDARKAAASTTDIIDSAAKSVVNINRLGVKALAKRVTANTTVDMLSDENERKENRNLRVGIDPMTGMQVLMAANQLSNINDQFSEKNRVSRLNYVGLEPLEASKDNYKVPMNDSIQQSNNNNNNNNNNNKNEIINQDSFFNDNENENDNGHMSMNMNVNMNSNEKQNEDVLMNNNNNNKNKNNRKNNKQDDDDAVKDSIFEDDVFDVD